MAIQICLELVGRPDAMLEHGLIDHITWIAGCLMTVASGLLDAQDRGPSLVIEAAGQRPHMLEVVLGGVLVDQPKVEIPGRPRVGDVLDHPVQPIRVLVPVLQAPVSFRNVTRQTRGCVANSRPRSNVAATSSDGHSVVTSMSRATMSPSAELPVWTGRPT